MLPNANDASNSPTTEDRLGLNYREIFQSLGASNLKTIKGNNLAPSKSVISIEEVNDDDFGGEETAACIIEEKDTPLHPPARPLSRSGRISIMCMTPTGRFQADSDALVLEDVSPVSTNSPALEHAALSRLSSRGGLSRVGQLQEQTGGSAARVWSPQPRHVGLSEFFLAGVQDGSASGRVSRERDASFDLTSVKPDKLSMRLLSQNVWKPLESVSANDDTINSQEQQKQQTEERKDNPRPIIPLLHEPSLSDKNNDRPDSQSFAILKPVEGEDDAQIHDFGIVDFLKAQPYMPKGFEDYSQVHRVSSVSADPEPKSSQLSLVR